MMGKTHDDDEVEIDLRELFYALKKHILIILAALLVVPGFLIRSLAGLFAVRTGRKLLALLLGTHRRRTYVAGQFHRT